MKVRVEVNAPKAIIGFNRLYFPNRIVKEPGGKPSYILQAEKRKSDGRIWIIIGERPGEWQPLSRFVESSGEEFEQAHYCQCRKPDCLWCQPNV